VGAILIARVERGLPGRQRENQPAMPRVDAFKPKNVTKKSAVRFGVFTEDNYVSAKNHLPSKEIRRLMAARAFRAA